jgi:hypothetical protein
MKLKMNLKVGDEGYDASCWLTGYRKRPTLTQVQRDLIEVEVRALAVKREKDIWERTWGWRKPR